MFGVIIRATAHEAPGTMALRLRIVSEQRRTLGSRGVVMFGVGGGSIGRAADNDLVLPDKSRFVSGHHARVFFRDGRYYLEDTSTNGTYINEADQPMARRRHAELNNGDILRFGEFHVLVSVDPHSQDAGDAIADAELEQALLLGDPVNGGQFDPVRPRPPVTPPQVEGHLDSSLNTHMLFGTDPATSGDFQLGNAFGQAVVVPFTATRPSRPPAAPTHEDSDVIASRRLESLQRAALRQDAPAVPPPERAGLDALCRGAGMDSARLPAEASAAMLQVAGRLLREMLVGLKHVEMRRSDGASPSLGGETDELLRRLLGGTEGLRPDPGMWLRQQFERILRHESALTAASHAACMEVLRQLDPAEIESRFPQAAQREPGARPGAWELYKDFYRGLLRAQGADAMPHAYMEGFARAYAESIAQAGAARD